MTASSGKSDIELLNLYEEAEKEAAPAQLAEKLMRTTICRMPLHRIIHPEKKLSLAKLLLIKILNCTPDSELVASLKKYGSEATYSFALTTHERLRKCFITGPSGYLVEDSISDYLRNNPSDTALQSIFTQYYKNNYSTNESENRAKKLMKQLGFASPLTTEQQNIINVSVFFLDQERVMTRLREIEQMLQREGATTGQIEETKEHKYHLKGYEEGKPLKHNKLLSRVLYKIAMKAGFGEPITLETEVDSKTFSEMFEDKHLFKDKAFGGEFHGEWTHVIQWACIILEYNANPEFLPQTPQELYKWFGSKPGIDYWDIMFEGGKDKTMFQFDAGSVVDFDKYLRSSASLFPLLQQLLQSRAQSRVQENKDVEIINNIKKILIAHDSKSESVTKLEDILEEKKEFKKTKSTKLLNIFASYFQQSPDSYPEDLVKKIEKEFPNLRNRRK